MPARTVQLTDKAGNNIYPLAGWIGDDTISTGMINDSAVTTAKINDGAVTSAKIADGTIATADIANSAVTSSKIDWTTIRNIDVQDNFDITASKTRAYVTVFGKIGFVDLAFQSTSNIPAGHLVTLPDELNIIPLYTTELNYTIGDTDSRRALIEYTNGHTYISVGQHTSSANQFCRIFGMFFLQ